MAKSGDDKPKRGRPAGSGRYDDMIRVPVSGKMKGRVLDWGQRRGAVNLAEAVRKALAQVVGEDQP